MFLELSGQQKDQIHLLAKTLKGLPYKFGAEVDLKIPPTMMVTNRVPIDCSELVQYIFYQIGISVRDGSYNQFADSMEVDTPDIGDLVFKHKNKVINHVGVVMSLDPVVIVEADGWRGQVVLTMLDSFTNVKPTASQYAGMRRLLKERVVEAV